RDRRPSADPSCDPGAAHSAISAQRYRYGDKETILAVTSRSGTSSHLVSVRKPGDRASYEWLGSDWRGVLTNTARWLAFPDLFHDPCTEVPAEAVRHALNPPGPDIPSSRHIA